MLSDGGRGALLETKGVAARVGMCFVKKMQLLWKMIIPLIMRIRDCVLRMFAPGFGRWRPRVRGAGLAGALMVAGAGGWAAEGGAVSAEAERVAPRGPDHLVPIEPFDDSGYSEAVFKSLVGGERARLWMIVRPSFQPESAVVLRAGAVYPDGSDPANHAVEESGYILEHVEAKAAIWRYKDVSANEMELDIHVTKEVKRNFTGVPADLADVVSKAWAAVLKETRYPKEDQLGLDGVTYQFGWETVFFGETWSPQGGVPQLMARLGEKLGELAKAGAKERGALLEECRALAKELLAAAEKAGGRKE